MHAEAEALEPELGYRFRDRELLRRALTHKSRAREEGLPEVVSENEQLEFLGDSILGFVVSEWLVEKFPSWPEGRLSILKAYLVSAAHLYEVAQTLHLGDHLILGRGEELTGGRTKRRLLANALEAVIAATYQDGGLPPAKRLILDRVLRDVDLQLAVPDVAANSKEALREIARQLHLPQPHYTLVREYGPDHAKSFVIEVSVGNNWSGQGEGFSKKSAEQKAARIVLDQLKALTA